jgi:hypothetical protein
MVPAPTAATLPLIFTSPVTFWVRMPTLLLPATSTVPLLVSDPVSGPPSEMPALSLPSMLIVPLLTTEPVKAPSVLIPKRRAPWAMGPSLSPSLSSSAGVKFSSRTILPLLVIVPVVPALAWMPAESLAPVIWIVPSFLTLLALSIVTATPPVGTIEPALVMRMSSRAPFLTVDVAIGVVRLSPMVVSAKAGAAVARRMIGVRQVQASKLRILAPLGQREPPDEALPPAPSRSSGRRRGGK